MIAPPLPQKSLTTPATAPGARGSGWDPGRRATTPLRRHLERPAKPIDRSLLAAAARWRFALAGAGSIQSPRR